MSKERHQKPNGMKPENQEDDGLARAFFQAEIEFQAKPSEEWKVQRGRNRRKESGRGKQKEEVRNNFDLEQGRSRSTENMGRGSKRLQSSDDRSTFSKRPVHNADRGNSRPSQSGNRKRDFDRTHDKDAYSKSTEYERDKSSGKKSNTDTNKPHREQYNSTLSYTRLQQISLKDSTDIIRTLANSKSGLDEFLSGKIKPDCMYLIIKILSKLVVSDWEENKEHVLIRATTPEFFKKLTEFVTFLVTDEQNIKRREEMEQFFENLLTFFQAVMTMLPMVAADHLTGPLRATRMAMNGVTEFQNVTINTSLQERMKQIMSDFEERKKEKEERERVMKEQKEALYPQPLGSIKDVPLYPRPEDIADSNKGSIAPNKIEGPYNNVEHYLDIQFRLLREDFISPIRQGINEYRRGTSSKNNPGKKKVSNIRLYHRVKFIKPKVILDKVGYDICFDPEKRMKVKWEYSKRFIFGSLLLFTTDNFHTFFLATVVNRDLKLLEKDRSVSVVLCDTTELAQNILSKEFLMAESEVYFEPYLNVLKALQRFNSETFPLKKYFVYVDKKSAPPAYTQNGSDVYNISCGDNGIGGNKTIKLHDDYTWPSNVELGFDQSQMKAFKAALTHDLAIIQGPPGTGKTYLGLKIAAALLENAVIWNYHKKSPLLVICYTNHALDQFLEGILEKGLTNNLVRVGGRSKSSLLEPFNLKERRKSVAYYSPNYDQAALLRDLKTEMSGIFESIKTLQDNLDYLDQGYGILSLKTLSIVMSEGHKKFFRNNDDLLQWLLQGVNLQQKKLISTDDKGIERQNNKIDFDEYELDPSDFENFTRLKEVLFDSIELEDPTNFNSSNNEIRIYFMCTYDEIQKKIEDNSKLLESIPSSEGMTRDEMQQMMREMKMAQGILKVILVQIQEKLRNTGIPKQEDTNRLFAIENVNSLSSDQRWVLYKSWIEFLKAGYWMMIGKLEERYRQGARRYDEVRQFDDLRIVQQADVVGITTTTAARLQGMLRELKPRIVIVEEAAEVLEAHIIASLSVYCQHLILIGDHKQLRPSPADYRIGKDLKLEVSLFERLINNGICFHTLITQHRMRPEISRLLVPTIYKELHDHPSTLNRKRIRGLDTNVFFMTHNHFEEEVVDIMSKRNLFEARMVMLLARHLLLQGYKPDEITVLATYSGQMYLLKDEQIRLEISKDLLVTVVDNYQGEENKIILLSLVRSNPDNKIGFLKTENRVCVALSRARDGLYIIGNMDCLTANSDLWEKIKQSLKKQNAFGPKLVLRCETHPRELTSIMKPEDFSFVKEGGCHKPCGETLPCGHICKSLCHVSKDRHARYRCSEPCNRFLCEERHLCPKKCYQECGQCNLPMKRTLACGHSIMLQCSVEYTNIQCKELVKVTFPGCGHEVILECFRRGYKTCPEPCPFRLECGHACTKTCHVNDDPDHIKYECHKPCSRPPIGCNTEGHKCPTKCYERCQKCSTLVVKQLDCGHTVTTQCTNMDVQCDVPCQRTCSRGHKCKKMCREFCGPCPVKVEKVVPLCGHKVRVPCSIEANKRDCNGKCCITLRCGHKCAKRCKDECSENDCLVLTPLPVKLPCGHRDAMVPCNMVKTIQLTVTVDEEVLQYCSEPCLSMLKCSHRCSGTCGQCMQGRIHKVCDEDCGNTLICGHSCPVPCRQVCPPCEKPCQNRCVHSKCSKKCGEPCIPCKERCEYKCLHSYCTKKCGDLCNRKPCTEPCFMKHACGHSCVGFCGEPCPPCKECNPEPYEEFFFTGEETEEDAKWVLLNDCKHVVESRILEQWLGMDQEGSEIKLKTCPKCRPTEPNRYIATTQRYLNMVKQTFRDIQAVKEKVYGQVEKIREDRKKLLKDIQKVPPAEMDLFSNDVKGENELHSLYQQLLNDLPSVKNERRKEIDIERFRVLDYMTSFLLILVEWRKKIWSKLNENAKLTVCNKVNTLTKMLRKREKKIAMDEIESFNLELNRIVRLGDLLVVESSDLYRQSKTKPEVVRLLKTAENLITHFSRYTDDLDRKASEAVRELEKTLKMVSSVTDEERKMINAAMSKSFYGGAAAQGHWFKCPNGHIYCITECGGAMQTAKCPVNGCGLNIGGQNHTYLPGQQLASEMDGASRPAWSSGFDMNNFDLNNLH